MKSSGCAVLKVLGLLFIITFSFAGCVLCSKESATITLPYEIVEPEKWVGNKFPIFKYIDIGESLKKGKWIILFYHYDCPNCIEAITKYEQITFLLKNYENYLQFAMVEVPPHGTDQVLESPFVTLGKISESKEWFFTTPTIVVLTDEYVRDVWVENIPNLSTIIESVASVDNQGTKSVYSMKSVINRLSEF